jgi:hypothetical protein
MNINFRVVACITLLGFFCSFPVFAEEASNYELAERLKKVEESIKKGILPGDWGKHIILSGAIEVEGSYEKKDLAPPAKENEKSSDISLSKVELGVDADIAKYVDGHVLFLYEDGEDVTVDEGFISLSGADEFPAYLIAGKQYIPFGYFDTHFISDPTTLVLGETNEGAATIGYRFGDEILDISLGVFNGRAKKAGDDDVIDNIVAGLLLNPFDGLTLGASYISNLAGSDSFNEAVVDPDNLESLVAGWSASVTYEFLDRFKLIGEYLGALDNFKAGEIYDRADAKERKPVAWNMELGVAVTEDFGLAARYGGSDDGGDLLAEKEYGVVLSYGLFENTSLAVEYMHGEFENKDEQDVFTAQLAVAF